MAERRRCVAFLFILFISLFSDSAFPQSISAVIPSAPDRLSAARSGQSQNGNFTYGIDLAVPQFRGLEPRLRLAYDSSQTLANAARHQHWLGIGWTLEGHSSIERAAPGRGTPFFDDARDVFLLDGEELLACPSGTASPGCASGGTHAARVESYLRIARDTSANRWTITGRDGTAHVYNPIATWLGSGSSNAQLISNFRWLLASVADTRGNRIDYDYRCEADAQCYPKSIRYNGTVVTFHLEARPTEDQNSYATGLSLAQAKSRIATVDITTGGERVRAYRLTYAQSPSTKLSRLVSVQQFGSDARLDATTGTITGGSALPATELSYSDQEQDFTIVDTGLSDSGATYAKSTSTTATMSQRLIADFNGDGRSDIAYGTSTWNQGQTGGHVEGSTPTYSCSTKISGVYLAIGTGFSQYSGASVSGGNTKSACAGYPSLSTALGDFNGDFAADDGAHRYPASPRQRGVARDAAAPLRRDRDAALGQRL